MDFVTFIDKENIECHLTSGKGFILSHTPEPVHIVNISHRHKALSKLGQQFTVKDCIVNLHSAEI